MDIKEILKKNIQMYSVIVTGILLALLILNNTADNPLVLDATNVVQILVLAFLGTLPTFIFYSKKELSKVAFMVRSVIHVIVLEVLLMVAMFYMKWFDFENILMLVLIMVSIFVVYIVVRIIQWIFDQKEADKINKGLQNFRDV